MDAIHRQEFVRDLLLVFKKHNFPTPEIQSIQINYYDGSNSLFPSWLANGTRQPSLETILDRAEDQTPPPIPTTPATDCTSQCALDILATLEEVGHRLTTSELATEMEQKNRLWGTSTLSNWLARLVREGRLTNNPNARPNRGYGLMGWMVLFFSFAIRCNCQVIFSLFI